MRDGVRDDESCIVPMWIKGLVKGQSARRARRRGASPSWSDDEFLAFYAETHPIVEGLLRSCAKVRVACDPDRVHEVDGQRAIIHAWSVTDGEFVYGVGIDKRFKSAGFASDLARAVLGDALDRPMTARLDLVDITTPSAWRVDREWLTSLRALSARRLAGDITHASVAAHVIDVGRMPWVPRELRVSA